METKISITWLKIESVNVRKMLESVIVTSESEKKTWQTHA